MTTIDCGDAFYGEGFQTGAYVAMTEDMRKLYRVWLCVRWSDRRAMRLYVTE